MHFSSFLPLTSTPKGWIIEHIALDAWEVWTGAGYYLSRIVNHLVPWSHGATTEYILPRDWIWTSYVFKDGRSPAKPSPLWSGTLGFRCKWTVSSALPDNSRVVRVRVCVWIASTTVVPPISSPSDCLTPRWHEFKLNQSLWTLFPGRCDWFNGWIFLSICCYVLLLCSSLLLIPSGVSVMNCYTE